MKKQWTLQAIFYKKLIEKYSTFLNKPSHLIVVMDVGWVWDWVREIFKNNWVKVDISIRYTWGQTANTKDPLYWKIPKSLMINTQIDLIEEETYQVFEPSNKDLLEEYNYLYEDALRNGDTAMKTTFFDDIANSNMISLYAIKERKLISRAVSEIEHELISNTVEWYFAWLDDSNAKYRVAKQAQQRNNSVW